MEKKRKNSERDPEEKNFLHHYQVLQQHRQLKYANATEMLMRRHQLNPDVKVYVAPSSEVELSPLSPLFDWFLFPSTD